MSVMRFDTQVFRKFRSLLVGTFALALASLALVAQDRAASPAAATQAGKTAGQTIKVLLVGHTPAQAPHYPLLASTLARRGIQLIPLVTMDAATPDRLAHYDVVMAAGSQADLPPELQKVLGAFKGRVFYASAGQDAATWGSSEFHTKVEQGILGAVDQAKRTAREQLAMSEVVYLDRFNVPNYEQRDPPPQFHLPFTAQESMKFIQTPAEFTLELFASEPDIVKPISFSFDERGRLWVLETIDYPNEVLDGHPGDDRIKILEDTNGDGRADKFTVFAEGLNIPTSLAFANGGVVVTQAPHILFLKDTNGDDKADVRQVLSNGWGNRDTHAQPSNLQVRAGQLHLGRCRLLGLQR